ncbi:hypothetical protein ACX8Z9_04700 [Arthrobacter halodurans]|uniref:K+-transporting ATPase, KdpF subunit n=1 Tax=Arthrobacter halodurans TaxID=516699 RepID=A0ABV4US06_9MICC
MSSQDAAGLVCLTAVAFLFYAVWAPTRRDRDARDRNRHRG